MTTLREALDRLEQPIPVDRVRLEVHAALRAGRAQRDALVHQASTAARELVRLAEELTQRIESTRRLHQRTSGGLMGGLLSSLDREGVEKRREQADFALSGDLAVLEARIALAAALPEQLAGMQGDCRRAGQLFASLQARARAAELDEDLVSFLGRSGEELVQLGPTLQGADTPVAEPLSRAEQIAHEAATLLGELRGTERAATFGESVVDAVASPDSGTVGQLVRHGAHKAAPGLVPSIDRGARSVAAARADVEATRRSARTQAQREADALAAAMAELDALDEW